MNKRAALLIILITTIACKSGPTQQVSSVMPAVPSPSTVKATEYVRDDANVIDDATQKQLETTLAALKERKKERDHVEQNVSLLLLFVSVDDRQWRIQITRNLEPHLTNKILTDMSTPMTDSFKQKQYGEGIRKYVNAIIEKLDQLDLH